MKVQKIPPVKDGENIYYSSFRIFYSDTEHQHSHTGNNIHCHTHFQSRNVGDNTNDPWHQDAAKAGSRE